MTNQHLFELMNAAPGLDGTRLAIAIALADGAIWLIPIGMVWAWVRGDQPARRELLQMLLAALLALGFAQVVGHVWPHPRPFALHLGSQYLAHANDSSLPSDHTTVFWSLALSALATRRFALWGLPLLTAGLLVGWSRVYLGVHFPFDIVAAFPVAALGAVAARALREPLLPLVARILYLYRCAERCASRRAGRSRQT